MPICARAWEVYNNVVQYENRLVVCQSRECCEAIHGGLVALLDLLLPPHCVLCNLPAQRDCLCSSCREALTWASNYCVQCGLPLSVDDDRRCGYCVRHNMPFTATVYPFQYLFPTDRLVQSFKFNRQLAAGRILARSICEWVISQESDCPDVLVPVPLHTLRMFRRGFNQAYDLAAYLSRRLKIPLQAGALRRRRNTRAQTGLDGRQRRRNMHGAFYWRSQRPPAPHVALVDDVMTTGTTVSECARVLKKAGARRVDVWVAARAIPPGCS